MLHPFKSRLEVSSLRQSEHQHLFFKLPQIACRHSVGSGAAIVIIGMLITSVPSFDEDWWAEFLLTTLTR